MFETGTSTSQFTSGDNQTNRRPRATALVVEDHPDFLELLVFVLKSMGYNVLQANNGKDALRIAAGRKLDLLVTDLGLPEIDGLKLVQLVRGFNPDHTNLKIVMLTAYDVADYEPMGLEAGCDAVLSKPVDIQKFERVVSILRGATGRPRDEADNQPHPASRHDTSRHRNATMY